MGLGLSPPVLAKRGTHAAWLAAARAATGRSRSPPVVPSSTLWVREERLRCSAADVRPRCRPKRACGGALVPIAPPLACNPHPHPHPPLTSHLSPSPQSRHAGGAHHDASAISFKVKTATAVADSKEAWCKAEAEGDNDGGPEWCFV